MLHELAQQALRVGKRVHAETGIDRAGQSVVTAALDLPRLAAPNRPPGKRALVVGAGAMGALALATLRRRRRHRSAGRQPRPRRRPAPGRRRYGADRRRRSTDLPALLAEVDIVVSRHRVARPGDHAAGAGPRDARC